MKLELKNECQETLVVCALDYYLKTLKDLHNPQFGDDCDFSVHIANLEELLKQFPWHKHS